MPDPVAPEPTPPPVPGIDGLELVLFDLDGTLIDSIGLILDSYVHALGVHGKGEVSHAEILVGLGRPLRAHLADWAVDEAEVLRMVDTYRAWNRAHHDRRVVGYPGVAEALAALRARGVRTGVVTSKHHEGARRGLEVAGLADGWELVLGSDQTERHKPDPGPLLQALEHLGVAPERAAYVGDSPHDVAAANGGGLHSVAAHWGPFAAEALGAARTHLRHPRELAGLVRAGAV